MVVGKTKHVRCTQEHSILTRYNMLGVLKKSRFSHCELSIYMCICSNIPAALAYGEYISQLI
jgi:hypothetical protein